MNRTTKAEKIGLTLIGGFSVVPLLLLLIKVRIDKFAILPKSPDHFLSILTAPFIHENLEHYFYNILLFIPLALTIFYLYKNYCSAILLGIYFLSGLLVWLFGEFGYHIGLSGFALGNLAFIISTGIFSFNIRTLLISIIITIIQLPIILKSFVPQDGVSLDYHISGAIAGIIISVLVNKWALSGSLSID